MHCSSCGTELPAGSRFCLRCGHAVQASTPGDEMLHAHLRAAAPPALEAKVRAAAPLSGDRRVVTVLFVDIDASPAPAAGAAADLSKIVCGAFERLTPAIYHYEGTLARLVGHNLWAFFGAPVAHEDDPLRAVQAAIDLLEAARTHAAEVRARHGIDLAIRVGLNTGPVVIGPVDPDLRYELPAVDRTVDLATRLKFAAEPMTILITQETHRFVAPLFDCVEGPALDPAGAEAPIRVFQVVGRRDTPGRVRGLAGLESPMVGRAGELAALLKLFEAVRAGLGRAVLIVGEPGLGKTRLIAEWRTAVLRSMPTTGITWFEGRCLSYGQRLAYHLLVDLIRSLIATPEAAGEPATRAALESLLEPLFGPGDGEAYLEVYPYLGHLLALRLEGAAMDRVRPLDPQALQAQAMEALRKLLLALAARRPTVVVLEDIHWADPSSTELLIRLLPLASAAPILFCLVTRPERESPGWRLVIAARETLGGSLAEITLAPLSESDSRQMVAHLLRLEALPEQVRALILAKAEGNPFFVEEVIRMLIDRGAIVRKNGDWVAAAGIAAVDIPGSLEGLLLARIDRLPEEAKHTLRVAAVIGRQFPVRVLQNVLEGSLPP